MVKKATPVKRPPIFHYMVAIRETLARGNRAEIEQLLKAEKEVQQHYGGYDGLVSALEDALRKAK
jgi:hypothetical protein